jgi:hypothetical protein
VRALAILVAMAWAVSLPGCATRLDVDAREDVAPYATWAWLPRAVPKVHAPHRDGAALAAEAARLIEAELDRRGYRRVDEDADFYVAYQLALRRETVMIDQPQAQYELSTHTSDGAYRIQGTQRVPRVYEQLDLAVGFTDARGRTLWSARLTDQQEDAPGFDLGPRVAQVLESVPDHRAAAP